MIQGKSRVPKERVSLLGRFLQLLLDALTLYMLENDKTVTLIDYHITLANSNLHPISDTWAMFCPAKMVQMEQFINEKVYITEKSQK